MDKSAILGELVSALTAQLEDLQRQALPLHKENEGHGDFADQALQVMEDGAVRRAHQRLSELARDRVLLEALDIAPTDKIRPGAVVVVQGSGGDPKTLFIVPIISPALNNSPVAAITPNSPLGRALLNKKAGARVKVQASLGLTQYTVLSVE